MKRIFSLLLCCTLFLALTLPAAAEQRAAAASDVSFGLAGEITSFDLDAAGNVLACTHALLSSEYTVLLFDANGQYRTALSFRNTALLCARFDADGNVELLKSGSSSAEVLSPDGRYLPERTLDEADTAEALFREAQRETGSVRLVRSADKTTLTCYRDDEAAGTVLLALHHQSFIFPLALVAALVAAAILTAWVFARARKAERNTPRPVSTSQRRSSARTRKK